MSKQFGGFTERAGQKRRIASGRYAKATSTPVVAGYTVPILIVRAALPATDRTTLAGSPTSPRIRTARS
ncbi:MULTISPECIES: hypothetical protein [unclassified Ensifer]|uniref:hypothetical protein n=1 Tax=unclassified Ensifer TaxID=2633371 RepID=UPI0013967498|nr:MULTISPECIES: hypothetical protein [unclassified Ensifer]